VVNLKDPPVRTLAGKDFDDIAKLPHDVCSIHSSIAALRFAQHDILVKAKQRRVTEYKLSVLFLHFSKRFDKFIATSYKGHLAHQGCPFRLKSIVGEQGIAFHRTTDRSPVYILFIKNVGEFAFHHLAFANETQHNAVVFGGIRVAGSGALCPLRTASTARGTQKRGEDKKTGFAHLRVNISWFCRTCRLNPVSPGDAIFRFPPGSPPRP